MKYYKIVREDGTVGGKGMTADGAALLAGQVELTKAEYDALELSYSAPPEPPEGPVLTVEQQLMLTQLQQQEVLDALIIAQLGGEEDV